MADEIRITHPMLKVLRAFMADPKAKISGAEITRDAHIKSGTLYPILARLEKAGWLASDWERAEASALGRPRRRLYRITAAGQRAAIAAFSDIGVGTEAFA